MIQVELSFLLIQNIFIRNTRCNNNLNTWKQLELFALVVLSQVQRIELKSIKITFAQNREWNLAERNLREVENNANDKLHEMSLQNKIRGSV